MQAAFQAHLSTLYAEDPPLRVSEQSAKEDTAEAGAAVDADKSTHALRQQAVRTGTHAESYYNNTIICYSYSKSLSLPGERIGFIATDNNIDDFNDVWAGLRGASGDLANVCAPTLFQMVVERCVDVAPNIADYVHNRQILREAFGKIGYTFADPSGAFYLFFKAPFGITAEEFMDLAIEHHVFVVPAGSFGCPEWLRLSFCVSRQTVEDSIPLFAKLYDEAKTLTEKK